ncbi:MAG: hypothetical protein QOG85_1493 [Gaiellaceae bacterium]|jgi:hypothetical protein|nr:hypothetical protein [Gaiellaceae bacterium]
MKNEAVLQRLVRALLCPKCRGNGQLFTTSYLKRHSSRGNRGDPRVDASPCPVCGPARRALLRWAR